MFLSPYKINTTLFSGSSSSHKSQTEQVSHPVEQRGLPYEQEPESRFKTNEELRHDRIRLWLEKVEDGEDGETDKAESPLLQDTFSKSHVPPNEQPEKVTLIPEALHPDKAPSSPGPNSMIGTASERSPSRPPSIAGQLSKNPFNISAGGLMGGAIDTKPPSEHDSDISLS